MERALIATGFGYSAERRRSTGELVASLLPRVRDIRRIGSAALDLCAVAAGAVDGYFEEGVKAWDVAAGGLIAREAGAHYAVVTPTGAERDAWPRVRRCSTSCVSPSVVTGTRCPPRVPTRSTSYSKTRENGCLNCA